jgi:hypothetical protein
MPIASIAFPPTSPDAAVNRDDDDALFEHAPPSGFQRRLGLIGPGGDLAVQRRALLVVLAAWLPLPALAIVQSAVVRADLVSPVLQEVGLHARYLIAAPLLVLGEVACAPRLNEIVRQVRDGQALGDCDRRRLDGAVSSTRTLLRSNVAEAGFFGLAYLIALATALSHPLDQLPVWAQPTGGMPRFSLSGWWHVLVSLPLLLLLILGWFWRLALWSRLLWRISTLELRLVASHPDGRAGLSFLGHSVRAFAVIALALATIAAGRSANVVLATGKLPTAHLIFDIALLSAIAALFVAPLLVFTPILMQTWRQGAFAYDALAERVGRAFERTWLAGEPDGTRRDPADFSAAADLYSIVKNVHAIRLLPVSLKDLIPMAIALLLPSVPVILLSAHREVIWAHVASLLF